MYRCLLLYDFDDNGGKNVAQFNPSNTVFPYCFSIIHTHTHTHARTHAYTHTHTHARTHARTHTHTHIHTHTHTATPDYVQSLILKLYFDTMLSVIIIF